VRMRADICVKCIRKHRGGHLTEKDRKLLEERKIICPEHDGDEPLNEPPETCPWRLEHVIDGETENGPHDWIDVRWQQKESGLFIPS